MDLSQDLAGLLESLKFELEKFRASSIHCVFRADHRITELNIEAVEVIHAALQVHYHFLILLLVHPLLVKH